MIMSSNFVQELPCHHDHEELSSSVPRVCHHVHTHVKYVDSIEGLPDLERNFQPESAVIHRSAQHVLGTKHLLGLAKLVYYCNLLVLEVVV